MQRPKQPHLLFDAFNLGNYLFVDLFMPDFIYFWIQLLFECFQSEYDVLIVLLSLAWGVAGIFTEETDQCNHGHFEFSLA